MKPVDRTAKPRPSKLEAPPAEQQPTPTEKLTVDLKTDKGHMTMVGTATAVIAALAVIRLIVISIYVVKLAERAIDRTQDNVPAETRHR